MLATEFFRQELHYPRWRNSWNRTGLTAASEALTSGLLDLFPSWLGCDSTSRRRAEQKCRTRRIQARCARRRRTAQLAPGSTRFRRIGPFNKRRSWFYSTTIPSSARGNVSVMRTGGGSPGSQVKYRHQRPLANASVSASPLVFLLGRRLAITAIPRLRDAPIP